MLRSQLVIIKDKTIRTLKLQQLKVRGNQKAMQSDEELGVLLFMGFGRPPRHTK